MTAAQLGLLLKTAEAVKVAIENFSKGQHGTDGKPLNVEWSEAFQKSIDAVRDEDKTRQATAPRLIRFRDDEKEAK